MQVLPKIRGGGEEEENLTEIMRKYDTSKYSYDFVEKFLDARTRELGTIAHVLSKARRGVVVDFGNTAEGNACIQVK